MARTKAKKSKARRQAAPLLPKATRRISDSRLMEMLDEHMQESLSDIAALYQRLSSQLGYGSMKFSNEPRVQSSLSMVDRALDTAAAIANWRKACDRYKVNSKTVMMVVADGMSVSGIMQALRLTRESVRAHMRACLTVWSFWRKRCSQLEVFSQLAVFKASDRTRKMPRRPIAQPIRA